MTEGQIFWVIILGIGALALLSKKKKRRGNGGFVIVESYEIAVGRPKKKNPAWLIVAVAVVLAIWFLASRGSNDGQADSRYHKTSVASVIGAGR